MALEVGGVPHAHSRIPPSHRRKFEAESPQAASVWGTKISAALRGINMAVSAPAKVQKQDMPEDVKVIPTRPLPHTSRDRIARTDPRAAAESAAGANSSLGCCSPPAFPVTRAASDDAGGDESRRGAGCHADAIPAAYGSCGRHRQRDGGEGADGRQEDVDAGRRQGALYPSCRARPCLAFRFAPCLPGVARRQC